MPEKTQHTAASLQERMSARYDDGLHHKHNKYHLEYRKHYKSHPCIQNKVLEEEALNSSTGLIHEFKLKKLRKRLNKGQIH